MKKMISIVLALVLASALAVTCFAAANIDAGNSSDVTATITTSEGAPVYGADIVFDAAVAYSYGKTWSPEALDYVDDASGTWTDDTCSVSVTNKSNAPLYATVAFEAAEGISMNGTEATQALECAAATVDNAAPAQTATFKLAGSLVGKTSAFTVGSINVTFSKTAPQA